MKDKQDINIHCIVCFEVTETRKELSVLNTICLVLCQLLYVHFLILSCFSQDRNFCLHFVKRKLRIRELSSLRKGSCTEISSQFLYSEAEFLLTIPSCCQELNHLPWHVGSVSGQVNAVPLEQWFFALMAHWNHLQSFKKYWCPGPISRESDLISLLEGLDIKIF